MAWRTQCGVLDTRLARGSACHDYVFFLLGVALHFSTVARRGGGFVFSLLELRHAYTHYTPGMDMGWGYIMIPSSSWERKGWDGTTMGRGVNTTSRGSTRIYLAVCVPRGPRPGLPKIKVQVMTRRRSIWCRRRRVVFGMRREMMKPQKVRARGLPRTGPSRSVVVSPSVGVPLGSIRGSREPPRWGDRQCLFRLRDPPRSIDVGVEKGHSINMT